MRAMRRTLTASLLLLALVLCQSAQATYDPLSSGTTKIVLDKGFLSLLAKHKVKLSAKAPAKLKGGILILPVTGGEMDPTTGKGTIEHEGALVFQSKRHSVPFKAITLKAKRMPLIAKVGGSQLKVARAKRISSKREGFGEGFSAKGLLLTQKVATRLDKKLGLKRLLTEGEPFGRLASKTQPITVTILDQGQATLLPDPAFMAKLKALFVSLNPIFPAEGRGGVFSFPIGVGGAISPDATTGTLRVTGDLEFLQLGGGQVFWHEPWLELAQQLSSAEVDVEPVPAFPGKLGRTPILTTAFAGAPVSADPKARTISLSGAPAALTAQSAAPTTSPARNASFPSA